MPTETVQLKTGDQYVVRLKGLATAGYEWVYENSDEHTAGVQKTIGGEPPAGSKILGGSTMEEFTVTALQKGEATLRFSHVRQWDNQAPREEKLVKLVIK